MPAPEDVQQYQRESDETEEGGIESVSSGGAQTPSSNDPLGLMREIFGESTPMGGPARPPVMGMGAGLEGLLGGPVTPITPQQGGASLLELLSDPTPPSQAGLLDPVVLAPISAGTTSATPSASAQRFPSMTAFQKNGLTVVFDFDKPAPNLTVIMVSATNSTPTPMTNFSLLAAVPRVRTINYSTDPRFQIRGWLKPLHNQLIFILVSAIDRTVPFWKCGSTKCIIQGNPGDSH